MDPPAAIISKMAAPLDNKPAEAIRQKCLGRFDTLAKKVAHYIEEIVFDHICDELMWGHEGIFRHHSFMPEFVKMRVSSGMVRLEIHVSNRMDARDRSVIWTSALNLCDKLQSGGFRVAYDFFDSVISSYDGTTRIAGIDVVVPGF